MARYIDADVLLDRLKLQYGEELGWQCTINMSDVGMMIEEAPTADVAEVKHAEWKWGEGLGGQYGIWCTNCGSGWVDSENAEWIAREHDYCGKCGAKMDGERKEK